jgi:hypothetical protein
MLDKPIDKKAQSDKQKNQQRNRNIPGTVYGLHILCDILHR